MITVLALLCAYFVLPVYMIAASWQETIDFWNISITAESTVWNKIVIALQISSFLIIWPYYVVKAWKDGDND